MTVFHVWHQGDPSVGAGTLTAKVEVDIGGHQVDSTKELLIGAFSTIWGAHPRMVHIIAEAEYDKYTSDHEASS